MIIFAIFTLIFFFGVLYTLKKKQFQLGSRILISLVMGVGYGLLLRIIPNDWLFGFIQHVLRFIGNGYLSLLKMLVIPLILTSIIHAILNLGKESHIKKMSFLACAMLLGM